MYLIASSRLWLVVQRVESVKQELTASVLEFPMSILDEISSVSLNAKRIELAKLLATGLIRMLLQTADQSIDDEKEPEKSSAGGLEDS